MKKIIYYTVCCLFLFSCEENKDGIILDDKPESVLLSEIVDSVTYIELETKNECLIGYINCIKYINQNYYLYDHSTKSIYVFDENGKYMSKFCRYGQGPGEYLEITAFQIDSGKLHVLDIAASRILVYDVETCSYEYKIDIDRDYPRDFIVLGNEYVLFMHDKGNGRQGAFVFSPDGHNYTKITDTEGWNAFGLNIYFINDSTLFDHTSNIVYRIRDRKAVNLYHFSFNKQYNTDTKSGYQIYSCCESGNIIALFSTYFEILDMEKNNIKTLENPAVSFYNKLTGEVRTFDKIKNDIDSRGIYGDVWSLNNKIVNIIYGEEDENGFEKNPVLQILHMKDNY